MSAFYHILFNQVNFTYPNNPALFKHLSLSFGQNKTAIIGRNGSGKSTLMKLIVNQLTPDSGSISVAGQIFYLPQNVTVKLENSIAEFLGIQNKLDAYYRILSGSINSQDFNIFNEDWNLLGRTQAQLKNFRLEYLSLNRILSSLSGGELTRLFLCKTFLPQHDIILLDEPTNNLDLSARNLLYDAIEKWHKGLIVISHDRVLLQKVEQIIELTSLGSRIYGGNYDNYLHYKALEKAAVEHELAIAEKKLNNTQYSIQSSREKHDQRKAQGVSLKRRGKIDKLSANSAKGRSERTQARLSIQNQQMLSQAEQRLSQAKAAFEILQPFKIELPTNNQPVNKIILDIENLNFAYPQQNKWIIKDFNLLMRGQEKIALVGNNGSGKTTLVKLVMKKLLPTKGTLKIGVDHLYYFDQHLSGLHHELSIFDNVKFYHNELTEHEIYQHLAQFKFRNDAATTLVKNLSGGEKLRAMLAIVLVMQSSSSLLILDEPTNHLDLESMVVLETAMKNYHGAMIVISHDEYFLRNIEVTKIVNLPLAIITQLD